MGRHGTGGSDDGDDWGEDGSEEFEDGRDLTADPAARWAAAPDPTAKSGFWGPDDDEAGQPDWPVSPDKLEATGQWAPMPSRAADEAPRRPRSDPFETTGAFAPPPRPVPESPGETTGAFAPLPRPVAESPGESPGAFTPLPRPVPESPGETTGAFAPLPRPVPEPPGEVTGAFDQPFGRSVEVNRPPEAGRPAGRAGAFDPQPFETTGAFARPDWDESGGDETAGSNETRDFNEPFGATQLFGSAEAFGPPPVDPPQPGDVKVFGNPTMIDAPTPAWAEAESNFLGAGWSSDEPPAGDEPPRRRGRGRGKGDPDVLAATSGGGRGKVALLSVAAVAVVLGGTFAGVKMLSSSGDPGDCPEKNCVAVRVSNQPGPGASAPAEDEDPSDPADEPSGGPSRKKKTREQDPEPTATAEVPVIRRSSASPKPTPTRTQVRKTPKPTPKPTPTTSDDVALDPTDEPSVFATDEAPTDAPDDSPSTLSPGTSNLRDRGGSAGGQAVNVSFSAQQGLTGYTAQLNVVNDSAQPLASLTLSLPVRGRVLGVTGAGWTQDGDQLIIDMSRSLERGGSAKLTITAMGTASQPKNCGLVGGDCAIG